MSNMSRNNSINSLMGFSVHQPQLGAVLEFFPAMGSQQLDEMIDAYVPGNMSILDKRTTVTMEFFEHSMATGELFKFFMVAPAGTAESPASSFQDSGYGSAFASPVVSEPRWSASTSKKARIANARGASATTADFSHIPGMKIMTRDGQDVTNSASRGCKTKEQRDHAHLMRIMKACESCKKKKIRCDPSHKRIAVASTSDSKVKKASKKSAPLARTVAASAPPIATMPLQAFDHSFDAFMPSFEVAEQDSWEQFVMYDVDEVVAAPNVDVNYDFFHDPAGHFSPSASFVSSINSGSSSSSASPVQPFTPVQHTARSSLAGLVDASFSKDVYASSSAAGVGDVAMPALPYMSSDGFDSSHYVDFALYSPGSTASLDDDLSSYSTELSAASSSPQQAAAGGARIGKQSVLRNSGSSSVSRDRVSGDVLGSSSAFASMDEYGFDLGTSQGAQLMSGTSHRRRRVSSASGKAESVHQMVAPSQDCSDYGLPRLDESLVPRGQQDIPRPPHVQQQVTAVTESGSALTSQYAISKAPSARRPGTYKDDIQQRLRNTNAALTSQAADNHERPDVPVATSAMVSFLQPSVFCKQELTIRKAGGLLSQINQDGHHSVIALAPTYVGGDNTSIRPVVATSAKMAKLATAVTSAEVATTSRMRAATLDASLQQIVLAGPCASVSDENHEQCLREAHATHAAPEAMPAAFGSKIQSIANSGIPQQHQQRMTEPMPSLRGAACVDPIHSSILYAMVTLQGSAMLTAMLAVVGVVVVVAYAAYRRCGLVASLTLFARAVQTTASLMKLRINSAGPLKSNTSIPSYGTASSSLTTQTLGKTAGHIRSALPRDTGRKAGERESSSIVPSLLSRLSRWPVRHSSPFLTSSIVTLR